MVKGWVYRSELHGSLFKVLSDERWKNISNTDYLPVIVLPAEEVEEVLKLLHDIIDYSILSPKNAAKKALAILEGENDRETPSRR